MSSVNKELSRDRTHQHSASESGRISVPMWDSSDPERAPPPLPLNPGGSNQSPTKPNTSAAVAAVAQALTDRARESASASLYVASHMHDRSLEKSPTRTPQHKRLQSLQNGNLKDFKVSLETIRSPDHSPERSRPSTPLSSRDYFSTMLEGSPSRTESPTLIPVGKDINRDTPTLRSSTRPIPRLFLGENSPPSATMLALQNMQVRDVDTQSVLGDITNGSTSRTSLNFDSIHSQMINLTAIATTLQKEMTALSRRSKDNATDLISLKEATSRRDEDIRKSLRELVNKTRAAEAGLLGPPPRVDMSRSSSAFEISSHFLDSRPFNSPPFVKSVSLPKIPSMHSSEQDHERIVNQYPYAMESAASVAMLEKIIREMVTKEGQEQLLCTLSELFDKSRKESCDIAKKVEELVESNRVEPTSQALIRHKDHLSTISEEPPQLDVNFNGPHAGILSFSGPDSGSAEIEKPAAASFINDDLMQLLQKIKDSIAQSGGMTGEVKSLVRELRAEVLGMGRELGRKLETVDVLQDERSTSEQHRSGENLGRIVKEGLADLKAHMDQVIQLRRRQSSGSTISRNTVDSQEVYDVVKHALAERGLDQAQVMQNQASSFDREAILTAVREAYEAYKPEIELQQFGLERDEILQCLKEGLEDYQSSREPRAVSNVNREEVMNAVQEAMQHFTPPTPVTEAAELKEEVLMAVRESLANFRPSTQDASQWKSGEITRDEVLDAVREGLADFKGKGAREVDINREDLFEAIQAGLEKSKLGGYGDRVLDSLHEIVEGMRVEFKQYSAANGRDTEQVLDAVKDGLETLRAEIESYVGRAQDVTGKDEIVKTVKDGLEHLRSNVESYVAHGSHSDSVTARFDLLKYIKAEFEQLHEAVSHQYASGDSASQNKDEILIALNEGFAALKCSAPNRGVDEPTEEILDAMKEEFEQLREAVLNGSAAHKDEVLDALQDSLAGLHGKLTGGALELEMTDKIVNSMKEEFRALHDSVAMSGLQSNRIGDREDFVNSLKHSFDNIRVQLSADQSEAASESLGLIKEELEHFREALGSSLVSGTPGNTREEIVHAIRESLENFQPQLNRRNGGDVSIEAIEAVRGELEYLRQSLATTLIQNGARIEPGEILDTVRLGLDDLRAHISKKLDNPEHFISATGQMLNTLNDGLDGLRMDITKTMDKPVDLTLSYEILDTLKEGLASVKADMAHLKSVDPPVKNDEVILAQTLIQEVSTESDDCGTLNKTDLENLEVMLARLQIKVEAIDQNIQNPLPIPFTHDHSNADLTGIEALLQELQVTVTMLADRESVAVRTSATKEDTDAIETLLQNTKAKIDDRILPRLDAAVTIDHLDAVAAVVRATNDAVGGIAARIDGDSATKEDVTTLEILLQDIMSSLNDVKERVSAVDDDEKTIKSDIDIVGIVCTGIKNKLEELGSDALLTKGEGERLTELLSDIRQSHDSLRNRYETDIKVTAKAFDDRKEEAESILDQLKELKICVAESKDELKSRMKRSNQDVRALDEILQGIEDKVDAIPNSITDLHELKECVNHEFERAHATTEAIRSEQGAQATTILEKNEEHRAATIAELVQKLDAHFNEITARHDIQQLTIEQTAQTIAEKSAQQDELLSGSRTVAEDLKLTIDTLGSSVTALAPALEEVTQKISHDSKTVFNRVDDIYTKLEESRTDSRANQNLVRDEVMKSLAAIGGLREEVNGNHPKILDALQNLLSVTEQLFDHSKKSQAFSQEHAQKSFNEWKGDTQDIKSTLASMPRIEMPMLTAPPEKYNDAGLQTKLDELLDDSITQTKLDELLNLAATAGKLVSRVDKIDEIHQQLCNTSSEISAFLSFQTKVISAEYDNKVKEADQAALDLSKCLAEKEALEPSITDSRVIKETLDAEVNTLKLECKGLMSQKMRLAAEVSSLETALNIRREELHNMDARADALERRIIEGVMDHSRAMLMIKTARAPVITNLKRVPSNNSNTATIPSSAVNVGLGMTLKSRPAARRNPVAFDPAARRILSLSQITNNVPTGGKMITARPQNAKSGLLTLKRSQSVKNPLIRKSSWAGSGSLAEYDKENGALTEESDSDDDKSDHGTETVLSHGSVPDRHSRVSDVIRPGAPRQSSYGTGPSDYTYGTGSYFTGSETDRRTSYGSTIQSNVGAVASLDESIDEEDDGSSPLADHEYEESKAADESPEQRLLEAPPDPPKLVLTTQRTDGYDSGLGSDLPTAAPSASLRDGFFRKITNKDAT